MSGNRKGGLKSKKTIKARHGKDYYKKLSAEGGRSRDGKKHARDLMDKFGDDYFIKIRKRGKQNARKIDI